MFQGPAPLIDVTVNQYSTKKYDLIGKILMTGIELVPETSIFKIVDVADSPGRFDKCQSP